jgi:uncharacterized protein
MYQMIQFSSEGAILRGRLYLRRDGGARPRPIVIMTHGTSATITMAIDRYAEVLQEAGFAVLLYDHRNMGVSDGEPRGEINPWVQVRGYRAAIDYVCSLPEIDASRIAVWGDSFSAGQVLVVGACDERVKAIVSQTTACGPALPPADPEGSLFAGIKRLYREGDITIPDSVTGPLPVVSFDQHHIPSLLAPVSAFRWFIEYGGRHGSGWENWVTRVIPKTPVPYHPGLCAPHIQIPTLALISPKDEMAGANPTVSRAAFDSIPGPKQLIEIEGGHFGLLYYPGELFEQYSRAQRDFLSERLLTIQRWGWSARRR